MIPLLNKQNPSIHPVLKERMYAKIRIAYLEYYSMKKQLNQTPNLLKSFRMNAMIYLAEELKFFGLTK